MSKEKQIDELKTDLDTMVGNSTQLKAEKLYAKGWRKQREWISVDERLPKPLKVVLVCNIHGKIDTDFLLSSVRKFTRKDITHWMPLPEAPGKEGGAEK